MLRLRLHFASARGASARLPNAMVWRSAFGAQLRRQVCLTGAPLCTGCPLHRRCLYAQTFESRATDDAALLQHEHPAPNPYILAPVSQRTTQASGQGQGQGHWVDFTLFGSAAIDQAPILINALDKAAAAGLGKTRSRWQLQHVEQRRADGTTRPWQPGAPETTMDDAPPVPRAVCVHLDTPLRLRVDGHDLRRGQLTSQYFVTALLRRFTLLTSHYGDLHNSLDVATVNRLLAHTQTLSLESVQLRWCDQSRWSSRQQRRMPMGGIVGHFTLSGDLAPLWPWLWHGQWLHVGKGTVMGQGQYHLQLQRSPITWLVSRHACAVEFMQRQSQAYDHHVQHLDLKQVEAGDTVVGTLPIHLAACRP